MLLQTRAEFARRGVRVTVVAASDDLRDEFARYGLGTQIAASIEAAVGQKWAQDTHTNRVLAGLAMVGIGLALVGVAILLGG
jgi:hypothetical protein